MARSYSTQFRARNGEPRGFEGPTITGGPRTDLGAAAGTVNMGNSYGSLRSSAPEFDKISANAIGLRAAEAANLFEIWGRRDSAQSVADGQVERQKILGEAYKDAAGDASSGMMGGAALDVRKNSWNINSIL